MAEILDAANWAGRRIEALTKFKRSPTEAFNTAVVAAILYWLAGTPEERMAAVVQGIAVVVVAYFVTPLLQFTFEAFRAPSEQLQRQNADLRAEVERLSAIEARLTQFNVSVGFGPVHLVDDVQNPGRRFYVVVTDLVLTNRSEARIPIEIRLAFQIGDSISRAVVVKHQLAPDYVRKTLKLTRAKQFDRVVNLAERSATGGFVAFVVEVEQLNADGFKELKEVLNLPMWLQLKNTLTQKVAQTPLNSAARNLHADWQLVIYGDVNDSVDPQSLGH